MRKCCVGPDSDTAAQVDVDRGFVIPSAAARCTLVRGACVGSRVVYGSERTRCMDTGRFDTLTRSLTVAGSRRRALGTLAAALGLRSLAAPDDAAAARSGRCRRKPGECERCDRGKCEKK